MDFLRALTAFMVCKKQVKIWEQLQMLPKRDKNRFFAFRRFGADYLCFFVDFMLQAEEK